MAKTASRAVLCCVVEVSMVIADNLPDRKQV